MMELANAQLDVSECLMVIVDHAQKDRNTINQEKYAHQFVKIIQSGLLQIKNADAPQIIIM